MQLSVRDHIESVKNGETKVDEFIAEVMEKCGKIQSKYSPFITLVKKPEAKKSKGRLAGLPISVKDSICTNGIQTTAGSKILGGYLPPFDATCITNTGQTIKIVLYKGKWYLDGDLPCPNPGVSLQYVLCVL